MVAVVSTAIDSFILLWLDGMQDVIQILLCLLRLAFCPNMCT